MRLSNHSKIPIRQIRRTLTWLRKFVPVKLWEGLRVEFCDIHEWSKDTSSLRGVAIDQIPENRKRGGGRYYILMSIGKKGKYPYFREEPVSLGRFRIKSFQEDLVHFLAHEIYHCYQYYSKSKTGEVAADLWARQRVEDWRRTH